MALPAATAAAFAFAVPSASAVEVVQRLALPGGGADLQTRSGGGLDVYARTIRADRIRIGRSVWRGRGRVKESAVRAARLLPSDPEGLTSFIPTRTGPIAAYGTLRAGRHRIAVSSFDPAGRLLGTQILGTGGRSACEPMAVAGANGAVAVTFMARDAATATRSGLMMAFRPAGQRRFTRAQTVDGPIDLGRVNYAVAVGASGDGAIVATPSAGGLVPRVRRIGRQGALGPWVPIDTPRSDDAIGAVGVAPDGTVAVGLVAGNLSPDPERSTAVLATSMPGRTNALTPVQVLHEGVGRGLAVLEDLTVAVGPTGETVLAANTHTPTERLRFFAGPAAQLAPAGDAPVDVGAFLGVDVAATFDDDGGATAVWGGIGPGDRPTPVYASRRPPGGSFEAPTVVARPGPRRNASLRAGPPVALGAGRSAVVVGSYDGRLSRSRLVVLAP